VCLLDLDFAATLGLHVRNLMACGTLTPATLLVVEVMMFC
jgi:hypothetical protein